MAVHCSSIPYQNINILFHHQLNIIFSYPEKSFSYFLFSLLSVFISTPLLFSLHFFSLFISAPLLSSLTLKNLVMVFFFFFVIKFAVGYGCLWWWVVGCGDFVTVCSGCRGEFLVDLSGSILQWVDLAMMGCDHGGWVVGIIW